MRLFISVLFFLTCHSLAAQPWNGLERPDAKWYTGNWPTPIGTFGIEELDFEDQLSVSVRDSISPFKFGWSNQSFIYQGHTLVANGCEMRLAFDEVLATFDQEPATSFHTKFCETRDQPIGQQAFLPLNDTLVVYDKEVWQLGNTSEWSQVISGREVHLVSFAGQTPRVLERIPLPVQDSLLPQLCDYTSDGEGGWWGINRSAVSDRFHVFHYTADSCYRHSIQRLGPAGFSRERVTTRMRFNPAGTTFVLVGGDDSIDFYDFDRTTGTISVREILPIPDPDWVPYRQSLDADWSAEGRYAYVSSQDHIHQYDLEAPDLGGSVVRIDTEEQAENGYPYYRTTRGPDCRIYVGVSGAAMQLSVIDKPSLKGLACDLKNGGVDLPTIYFVGLPEFPNYALWAQDRLARGLAPIIDTAVCDSTILPYPYVSWSSTAEIPEAKWSCFPNPVGSGERLTVEFPATFRQEQPVFGSLYDAQGKLVANLNLEGSGHHFSVPLPDVPVGVYLLALGRDGVSLGVQQVVVR